MGGLTVALDSWAVLSVAKRQAGAETTRQAIERGGAVISWINLGEVYFVLARELGPERAQTTVDATMLDARAEVPDGRMVLEAAKVKARASLSYADAFCVMTGKRHEIPVLTGDPEIVALRGEIEVVDLRSLP